ncbi:aromatic prenyltransferase [Aspergillus ambiguus]|uniref:aromatic prenyltransferase n=1 Tax=Aspergillus ambiguus TaxID=176160 RepID=UPI003CCCEE29
MGSKRDNKAVEPRGSTLHQTPYEVLSKSLFFPDEVQYEWWHGAAPIMGKLLHDTNYDLHRQYQYLTLLAHHVIPSMGLSPRDSRAHCYPSMLGTATLFELSQNFQQAGCTIRVLFEPTSYPNSNHSHALMTPETLRKLQLVGDSRLDLQLHYQFAGQLALSKKEKERLRLLSDRRFAELLGTVSYIGLDLGKEGDVTIKSYHPLLPNFVATGKAGSDLAFRAVRTIDESSGRGAALSHIEGYMQDRTQGHPSDTDPRVFLMGCDLVDASQARVKLYIFDPLVTWDNVADIWTLGGRLNAVPDVVSGLEILRELWAALKLPEGYHFPEDAHSSKGREDLRDPLKPVFFDGQSMMMNFELRPGDPYPKPQVYLNLCTIRDSMVVGAVTAFFEKLGWMEEARSYKEKVTSYYPSCNLEETSDRLGTISFSYSSKNGPYTTVYYRHIRMSLN